MIPVSEIVWHISMLFLISVCPYLLTFIIIKINEFYINKRILKKKIKNQKKLLLL